MDLPRVCCKLALCTEVCQKARFHETKKVVLYMYFRIWMTLTSDFETSKGLFLIPDNLPMLFMYVSNCNPITSSLHRGLSLGVPSSGHPAC